MVSAETETTVGETGESGCWCCGRITAEEALVRLGKHPEVGLCINCVRFLGRRARDYQASVMRKRSEARLSRSAARSCPADGMSALSSDRRCCGSTGTCPGSCRPPAACHAARIPAAARALDSIPDVPHW